MIEVTYQPDAGRDRYRRLLREMRRDLTASTALARQFLSRQLRAEYRQTLLGGFLAFLPALGLTFWAVLADRAKILDAGETGIPYAAFVMLGLVFWQAFVESIQVQIETLASERALLAKLDLPPESLILAGLFRTLVNLAPKLVLVALVFVYLRQTVPWTVVVALVPVVVLVLLGTAIGLVLAPLHALYNDVGKGLAAVVTFWFFMTPVLYAVPPQGLFRQLVELNPVTPLLGLARDLAARGLPESFAAALWMTMATAVALPLAWFFYRLALPVVLEKTQ
jgi:lipopolysaccharide transport system permease protein